MKKNIFTTEDVKGIVDHMNDDHSNSLVHYCHLLGMSNITEKDKVLMAGIDQNGFDLKVNGENIRFELETPMKEAREVRKVLVSLAKKSLFFGGYIGCPLPSEKWMLLGQSDTWTSCNLPGALIKSAPVSYRILYQTLQRFLS